MIASSEEVLDSAVDTEISVDSLEPMNSRADLGSFGQREDELGVRERRGLVVFIQHSDLDLGFS